MTALTVRLDQLPEVSAVVKASLAYFDAVEDYERHGGWAYSRRTADLFAAWRAATAALRAAWGPEGDDPMNDKKGTQP